MYMFLSKSQNGRCVKSAPTRSAESASGPARSEDPAVPWAHVSEASRITHSGIFFMIIVIESVPVQRFEDYLSVFFSLAVTFIRSWRVNIRGAAWQRGLRVPAFPLFRETLPALGYTGFAIRLSSVTSHLIQDGDHRAADANESAGDHERGDERLRATDTVEQAGGQQQDEDAHGKTAEELAREDDVVPDYQGADGHRGDEECRRERRERGRHVLSGRARLLDDCVPLPVQDEACGVVRLGEDEHLATAGSTRIGTLSQGGAISGNDW